MKTISSGDTMMNCIIGAEATHLMETTVNKISSHFKTGTKSTTAILNTVITEATKNTLSNESNQKAVSPENTVSVECIQNTVIPMNAAGTEYSQNTRNTASIEGTYNFVNTISTKGTADQTSPITSNISPPPLAKVQDFTDIQPKEAVHVLAVDDSLIDRKFLEKLLRTSSYKVTTVDSAIRALEILGMTVSINASSTTSAAANDSSSRVDSEQEFKFNLIITDYCMPGMTGYELLKTIKGSSTLKEIPVIVMSSENVPNRVSSCLAEGAEEFLLKPLQLADVKRLRCHVQQSGLVQTNYCNKIRKANPVKELLLESKERDQQPALV